MTFGAMVVIGIGVWFILSMFEFGVMLLMVLGIVGLIWMTERRHHKDNDEHDQN